MSSTPLTTLVMEDMRRLRGVLGYALAALGVSYSMLLVRARVAAPWLASSAIAYGLAAFLIAVST